jgi:hypothetical protein
VPPKDATEEALRPCERGGRVGGLSGDHMFCKEALRQAAFRLDFTCALWPDRSVNAYSCFHFLSVFDGSSDNGRLGNVISSAIAAGLYQSK